MCQDKRCSNNSKLQIWKMVFIFSSLGMAEHLTSCQREGWALLQCFCIQAPWVPMYMFTATQSPGTASPWWSWQQHACNWAAMQPSKPSLDVKQQYATYHMGVASEIECNSYVHLVKMGTEKL